MRIHHAASLGWAEPAPVHSPDLLDVDASLELLEAIWRGRADFPCVASTARDMATGAPVPQESFTSIAVADLLPDTFLAGSIRVVLEGELLRHGHGLSFYRDGASSIDILCTLRGYGVLLPRLPRLRQDALTTLKLISRGPIDAPRTVDALRLAYQLGLWSAAPQILACVGQIVFEGSYLQWPQPDAFLYAVARLVRDFPRTCGHLAAPVAAAIEQRLGSTDHVIDLAQRAIAARWLGLDASAELSALLEQREPSGWWPSDGLFHCGRFFGSRALSTAFAIRAVLEARSGRVAVDEDGEQSTPATV